jgi:hypothetical protein
VILLGVGDGSFKVAEAYKASGTPASLVVGDYNGDKNMDIAMSFNAVKMKFIRVFLGNGDGTLQDPVKFRGGHQSAFIMQHDMNNDGHLDLITSSTFTDSLSLFLGDGKGEFHVMQDFAGEKGPQFMVADDFVGGRHQDLAVSNRRDNSISIIEGRGDGSFVFPHYNYPVGRNPRAMVGADFNHDGLKDLAVLLYDKQLMEVFLRKIPTRPQDE